MWKKELYIYIICILYIYYICIIHILLYYMYIYAVLKLQRNYPGIYYQSEPHPYLCLKAWDIAPKLYYHLHSKH